MVVSPGDTGIDDGAANALGELRGIGCLGAGIGAKREAVAKGEDDIVRTELGKRRRTLASDEQKQRKKYKEGSLKKGHVRSLTDI